MNMAETPETEGEEEPQSLRDALEAAYDAEEGGSNEEASATPPERTLPAQEEAEPAPAQAAPEPAAEPEQLRLDGGTDSGSPAFEEDPRYPGLNSERIGRAPEGWKPVAREGWAELPETVRREVHRREMDIAHGLEDSSRARKFEERFRETVQPYEALMRAEGAREPLEAVNNLLNTAGVLKLGTPQQKAERISALIQHYGVDVDALDAALSAQISGTPQALGAAPPVQQQIAPLVEQALEQRLAPYRQAQAQRVSQHVEAFKKTAEFFEDVRPRMIKIADAAEAQGEQIGIEEIYEIACALDPHVKEVVRQRGQQQQAATQQASLKQKLAVSAATRAPASNGDGSGVRSGDGSLRSAIEAAWDAAETP
jgi:hypothetical protein